VQGTFGPARPLPDPQLLLLPPPNPSQQRAPGAPGLAADTLRLSAQSARRPRPARRRSAEAEVPLLPGRRAGGGYGAGLPADAEVIEDDDLTLLPGFMDMHVHLAAEGTNLVRILMTPASLALLNAVPNSGRTLAAGVTTVRDAGHTPVGVRLAAEAGYFPAPRMQLAVSLLSQTGGHGDDLMPCGARVGLTMDVDVPHGVVDGVDGMRRKVREVLQAGADWIKLCTSGGVLSAGDSPDHAQFSVDEIRVAVEEAAVVGKRVMAHAMSAAGIRNALVAGVTSIEHGCLLDEECIALMKEKGAYLVPTLVAPGDVIASATGPGGSGLPAEMVEKAERIGGLHRAAVAAAIASGVKVAMGTDAAVGPHGRNLRELGEMVRCGMTPMQAIVASTTVPAELLRRSDLGSLEVGRLGDVVAVRGDPLADIDSLADPAYIRLVIKNGRVAYDFRGTAVAGQPSSGSSSSAAS
jgi:imidazolonepropionase-like amidohydrolase